MDSFTGSDWVDGVHHGGECHWENIFGHIIMLAQLVVFFPMLWLGTMGLMFQSVWKKIKYVFPIHQEMLGAVVQVTSERQRFPD